MLSQAKVYDILNRMGLRAAIYCRISRDRAGGGLGVDRQEADCRALAEDLGWTVTVVHVDNDLSAYSGKPRPAYRALLDDLRENRVDAILAWHTDRLHRSSVELEEFISLCEGRSIPTVTVKAGPLDLTTPAGRMVARQLGAVARYEVEHSTERIRRAKEQAASAGEWRGGRRPYGYEADGVTIRESEAADVQRMAEALLSGVSLGGIARELHARGSVTSTGRAWDIGAIADVLRRPRNVALIDRRGEIVGPASWAPILDEGTWRAVVGILSDPSRRTSPPVGRRWLLSGLALCGVCGASAQICTSSTPRRPKTRPVYACKTRKHVARDAGHMDEFVGKLVVAWLQRPDAVEILARGSGGPDRAELYARITSLRQRLDSFSHMYGLGEIDRRQMQIGTATVRPQLEDAERMLAEASRHSAVGGLVGVPDPRVVWEALGLDRRRAVVAELMTITMRPVTRKGRPQGWRPGEPYFDPTTVGVEWVY